MRRSILVSMIALCLAGLAGSPAWAQEPADTRLASGTREAFLEALALVPASPEALAAPVSYVDYRAVEQARPGAATPASFRELMALQDAEDPSADVWLAASMGIASGPPELLVDIFSQAAYWPGSLGLDFFDVDRALQFGSPPSSGIVLLGRFDPAAIGAAHQARGYTGTPVGDRMLWCGDVGCDAGQAQDLAARDPSVPFGGRLGRREPLAVSDREVLSSADITTLEGMLAAAAGEIPALDSRTAYRTLALAPAGEVLLVQATLLPGGMLPPTPDLVGLIGASPEEATTRVGELTESLAPIPIPAAIAILDGATTEEQVLTIALAFPGEQAAAVAADAVVKRLGTARSLTRDAALSDLLDERGVTNVEGQVRPATERTMAAAVVEIRAPLPGSAPGPAPGPLAPSSELYRLFVGMLFTRDLLWVAPLPR